MKKTNFHSKKYPLDKMKDDYFASEIKTLSIWLKGYIKRNPKYKDNEKYLKRTAMIGRSSEKARYLDDISLKTKKELKKKEIQNRITTITELQGMKKRCIDLYKMKLNRISKLAKQDVDFNIKDVECILGDIKIELGEHDNGKNIEKETPLTDAELSLLDFFKTKKGSTGKKNQPSKRQKS